jgi:hypothetical protein
MNQDNQDLQETHQELGQSGKINLESFVKGLEEASPEEEAKEEEKAKISLNLPLLTAVASFVGAMQFKKPENREAFRREFNEKLPEIIKKYGLEDIVEKMMGVEFEVELPETIKVPVPWWTGLAAIIIAIGGTMWAVSKKYREDEKEESKESEKTEQKEQGQ